MKMPNPLRPLASVFKHVPTIARYLVNRYGRQIPICAPPILIVGCGHSGTSLLLAALGSHPHIYAIPEETNFAYSSKPQSYIRRFNRSAIAAGKLRWVEKTPKHIRCIERLLELCPESRILLIVRDGRDVACSIRNRTGSLAQGIERWIDDNRAAEPYLEYPNIYRLKYEDLVTAFEPTLSAVFEFVGEELHKDVLEYHKTPKTYYSSIIAKPESPEGANHNQYRNWQINQPLFDGRGKWTALNRKEKDIIKLLANEMLMEYGYVDSDSW